MAESVERRLSLIERVMSSISVTVEEVEDSMRRSVSPDQTWTPGKVVSDDLVVAAAKERLRKLYLVFEESDTDDEPGLNIDEFKVAMRRIGGEEMTDREIELTFMKVRSLLRTKNSGNWERAVLLLRLVRVIGLEKSGQIIRLRC
ncbi:hypothetical protein RvY_07514 [Ramazzottius varieornatus]|uniref:EF-hand domain-containing protein n=1 Tax=Ramazzottius varieornatus TaxID=947166 RepID=A0A1D1V2G2_RAMVA|nr:hypothetical protein RvY_07514 [Ramazzottius varieornatus]